MDPRNSEWPFRLGFIIWLVAVGGTSEPDRESAAEALTHFARAHRLGGEPYGPWALRSAMEAAFEAGEVGDARGYALEILGSNTASIRDLRHWANVVIGRVALVDDDTEKAGEHLLAAGRALTSPSASGPNMLLARELLERGEREVGLAYFELCAPFWDGDPLDEWAAAVREGQIPDFGANLRYLSDRAFRFLPCGEATSPAGDRSSQEERRRPRSPVETSAATAPSRALRQETESSTRTTRP